MSQPAADPRDRADVDADAINATASYALYAVFSTTLPLPTDDAARARLADAALRAVEATGVRVRGWYDVAGFRADADLLAWLLADDPAAVQAAYHAILASPLGEHLAPVWSCVGVHRSSEFNKAHVPSCLAGVEPRPWVCVYPFVRSWDWYQLDADHRAAMLREHGLAGREYPDVKASTLASFGLSDYEWILAFEADELHRITDAMRHARGVEARLHVREETPFFTGPRVELADWAERQPRR